MATTAASLRSAKGGLWQCPEASPSSSNLADKLLVYRPRFLGHRIESYAASAAVWSCF